MASSTFTSATTGTTSSVADLEKRLLDAAAAIQEALAVVRMATPTPTAEDARLARLEQQVASLQKSNDKLQQQVDDFDAALDDLTDEVARVNVDVENERSRLDDLVDEVGTLGDNVDEMQREASRCKQATEEEEDDSTVMVSRLHTSGRSEQ